MPQLIVQPSAKDGYIVSNAPTTNYGTPVTLYLCDNAAQVVRDLLEFSLNGLPAGSAPYAAKLYLYYYLYSTTDPVGKTVWAYKLSRTDWVEIQATWNIYKTGSNWSTAGGDYVTSGPAGASVVMPAGYGWIEFDVTAIVLAAKTAGAAAEFLVKFADEAAGSISLTGFYSREYTTDATKCPKLIIDYILPPTTPYATTGLTDKVTVTWTKSTAADGYRVWRDGVDISGLLGDVATYDDTTASVPLIVPGSAVATDGKRNGYVCLSIDGLTADVVEHVYKVTAEIGGIASGYSSEVTGYRKAVGDYTYQWQRSAADSDADYSNIDGATRTPYNDTGAPAYPAARYYKCVISMTYAANAATAADRGYRRRADAPANVVNIIIKDRDGATLGVVMNLSKPATDYRINTLPACGFSVPAAEAVCLYLVYPNEAWYYVNGELADIFKISGRSKNSPGIIEVTGTGLGWALTQDLITSQYVKTITSGKTVTNVLTDLLAYQLTSSIVLGGVSVSLDKVIAIDTDQISLESRNIWEACKLVRDIAGGYLYVDFDPDDPATRRLWLLDSIGRNEGQQIRLGKNLQDVEHIVDYLQSCNRLYPVGDSSLNIEKVYTRIDPILSVDASYAYLTFAEQYGAYKGWTALGAAVPATVTVEKPTGAWNSPTGHGDCGTWVWPEKAYDGNEATYAYHSFPGGVTTALLSLSIPATTTTQIKVPSWWTKDDPDYGVVHATHIKADIYYGGAWHEVYSDSPYRATLGELITISFASQTITGIRLQYRNNSSSSWFGNQIWVKEVYVWNSSGFANDNTNWKQGANEKTLRCAIADYAAGIGYVLSYTHAPYFIDLDDVTDRDNIISRYQSFATSDQDTLMALGRVALAELPKVASPSTSINVGSVDLSGEEGMEFEELELGSTLRIIHEDLDIDESAVAVRLQRPDLTHPDRVVLELGSPVRDITDLI